MAGSECNLRRAACEWPDDLRSNGGCGTRPLPAQLHDLRNAALSTVPGPQPPACGHAQPSASMAPEGDFRIPGRCVGSRRVGPFRDPSPPGEGRGFRAGSPSPKAGQPPAAGWLSSHVPALGTRDGFGAVRHPSRGGAGESRPTLYLSTVNSTTQASVSPVPLSSMSVMALSPSRGRTMGEATGLMTSSLSFRAQAVSLWVSSLVRTPIGRSRYSCVGAQGLDPDKGQSHVAGVDRGLGEGHVGVGRILHGDGDLAAVVEPDVAERLGVVGQGITGFTGDQLPGAIGGAGGHVVGEDAVAAFVLDANDAGLEVDVVPLAVGLVGGWRPMRKRGVWGLVRRPLVL